MKTSLYCCGTAWDSERDADNTGMIEFYTSPEACLDDLECARFCGVVEVSVQKKKIAVPATETEKVIRGADIQKRQARYVALAGQIMKILASRNLEMQESALQWALGGVRRKRRERRRRLRER